MDLLRRTLETNLERRARAWQLARDEIITLDQHFIVGYVLWASLVVYAGAIGSITRPEAVLIIGLFFSIWVGVMVDADNKLKAKLQGA